MTKRQKRRQMRQTFGGKVEEFVEGKKLVRETGFVASASVWTGLLLSLVALDTFYLWVLVGPFQVADTFNAQVSEWLEHPPPHVFPPLPAASLSHGS